LDPVFFGRLENEIIYFTQGRMYDPLTRRKGRVWMQEKNSFALRAKEIWNNSKITAWVLVLAGMGVALWATYCPQSPGVSIGMLALVAGIMSLRPEMHVLEKCAWILLLVTFTCLEVHAIRISDENNQDIRYAQNSEFAGIVRKLTDSDSANQQHFDVTMGKFQDTTKRLETAQKSLTGITNEGALAKEASTKRQQIREKLVDLLLYNIHISGICRNVSGPGGGGTNPKSCIEDYKDWTQEADIFIQTLGEVDFAIFTAEKPTSHARIDNTAPQEITTCIDDLDAKATAIVKLILEYKN
jgi:hypothetical protein